MKKELSILESLLFVSGDKVETKEAAKIIEKKEKDTEKLFEYLKAIYDDEKRGLRIIKVDKGYQMTTAKENFDFLAKLNSSDKKMRYTQAVLETLAIIAYKQPITKAEIAEIRGVNSDTLINKLIERNIIEEVGRLERIGRPLLLGTTDDFLRFFGFSNLEELNKYREDVIEEKYKDEEYN